MPAIIELLPSVTLSGGGSSFALSGSAGSATTSGLTITQGTFTVYGVAFENPSATPAAAAIEAGTGAVATASGNAIASLAFTGLSSSTNYDFYIVGKDGSGEYTAVTKITASTAAPSGSFNIGILLGAGVL